MRLSRLVMHRFGHLTDVTLDFPARAALTVVLGANEAGKSTALAAIGDALFGFGHKTDFAFLHKERDLSIGMDLVRADGGAIRFVRRKGRGSTLSDETGQALPDDAMAPFLGGADRVAFDRMFGLDAAALRDGGREMGDGKGELGETLFQVTSGLNNFRAAARRIDEEAALLFTVRKGSAEIYRLIDAYKTAREAAEAGSLRGSEYAEALDERERLRAALLANTQRRGRLEAERRRAERIRRTVPALHDRSDAMARRALLGTVAALPDDAETRRQDAVQSVTVARHAIEDCQREALELGEALAGLTPDPAALAERDAIEALVRDASRIAGARSDREEQEREVRQHRDKVAEAVRALGQTLSPEQAADAVPDELGRAEVRRLAAARSAIDAVRLGAAQAHDKAAGEVARLRETIAGLPDAGDGGVALRVALDAARAEGKLAAERARAVQAEAAARRLAETAIAALPRWAGDAAALARAALPLLEDTARAAEALGAVEAAARAKAETQAQLAARIAEEEQLVAPQRDADPPTREAIARARAARDATWQAIRAAILQSAPPRPGAPDMLDRQIADADRIADRRADDATGIAAYEQSERLLASLVRQHRAASAALADAEAAREAAQARWIALWAVPGLDPGPPDAMRRWMELRDAALERSHEAYEAADRLRAIDERMTRHRATIGALLPGSGEAEWDALLAAAESACQAAESEQTRRRGLHDELNRAEAALIDAARVQGDAARRTRDWDEAWSSALSRLNLGRERAPEEASRALDLWERIALAAQAWRTASARIAEMRRTIDAYDRDATAVADRLGGRCPVSALAARLDAAQLVERKSSELAGRQTQTEAREAEQAARRETAQAALDGLCRIAGVSDETGLVDAIARAADARALDTQIARREQELAQQGDGRTIAELDAEAAGADLDALAVRVDAIDAETTNINAEDLAFSRRIAEYDHRIREMERGGDAAVHAQAAEAALADMGEAGQRWMRLRAAGILLRAGVERFRREQEEPLLRRAGQHFAALTRGRYERLGAELDERDRKRLFARMPDGTTCNAEALSEGTRDQLYLALRIAAIEQHAARAEPLPFIADDLLVNFDDERAEAGIALLAELGQTIQVILFTHHDHIAAMAARRADAAVLRLPGWAEARAEAAQ